MQDIKKLSKEEKAVFKLLSNKLDVIDVYVLCVFLLREQFNKYEIKHVVELFGIKNGNNE